MEQWLRWHVQAFGPSGPPQAPEDRAPHGGVLEYEASDFVGTRACIDRPSVAPPTNAYHDPVSITQKAFNLQYEREGGVPSYERSIDTPLSLVARKNKDVRSVP